MLIDRDSAQNLTTFEPQAKARIGIGGLKSHGTQKRIEVCCVLLNLNSVASTYERRCG
jgi:hypothetical protein